MLFQKNYSLKKILFLLFVIMNAHLSTATWGYFMRTFKGMMRDPNFDIFKSKKVISEMGLSRNWFVDKYRTKKLCEYVVNKALNHDSKEFELKYTNILEHLLKQHPTKDHKKLVYPILNDQVHAAIEKDMTDLTELLLNAGFPIDSKCTPWKLANHEFTFLHRAKSTTMALLLLKYNANINYNNNHSENTPLHVCSASIAPTLIRYNADMSLKNLEFFKIDKKFIIDPRLELTEQIDTDNSAFVLGAIAVGHPGLAVYASSTKSKHSFGYNGLTPTMKAMVDGNVAKLKVLLAHNPPDSKKVLYTLAQAIHGENQSKVSEEILSLVD